MIIRTISKYYAQCSLQLVG